MEQDLYERLTWFIRLRWLAVAGLAASPFVASVFGMRLNAPIFIVIAVFIGLYNSIFYVIQEKHKNNIEKMSFFIVNGQISMDLLCLTAVLQMSGGVENPFVFYFIFHIVLSSILLPVKAAFYQTTLAAMLFTAMVSAEYTGLLKHHPIEGLLNQTLYDNKNYLISVSSVFISTLYITLFLAVSISEKLRERERHLKEANKMLNEKDRIKSEYILRVSHDIKGHLAAIQSCIHPVASGITGPLNEGQSNLIKRAEDRSEKLLFFVKTLLNLTITKLKDSSGAVDFDMAALIRDAVIFVRPNAKSKHIDITAVMDEGPLNFHGSKPEINATLIEMLSNAVRYTPDKGSVKISLSIQDRSLIIKISDSGIGISPDELPKIFDEFFRGTNAKKIDHSSSGLGLAMAKQVVEQHKGSINVFSEKDKGTTFEIILPRGQA